MKTIYTLRANSDGIIRYVGSTAELAERLHGHKFAHRNSNTPVAKWVAECCGEIDIFPIETVSDKLAPERERYWISVYLDHGMPLLNVQSRLPLVTIPKRIREPAPDFEAVERRAATARLTLGELADRAGIGRFTYWRARNGKHRRQDTVVKVLRALESALSDLERKSGSAG